MGLIARLLAEVWGNREGYIFLPSRVGTTWHEATGRPYSGVLPDPLMVRLDRDQYFCPLVFSKRRRKAEYALPTHVLWADLDTADPAKMRLRPSAVWQTTQGVFQHWQALWLLGQTEMHREVETFATGPYRDQGRMVMVAGDPEYTYTPTEIPAEQASLLSRRIAYAESGADKGGWDVTQVLRLPGTRNHKHLPAHRIELLWAERRYYTVDQVEAAYPSVLLPRGNGAASWGAVTEAQVDQVVGDLPVGVQVALERGGGDRSLELVRMARTLLSLNVPSDVIPHILQRSACNKFAGRSDEKQRLLAATADALLG